MKISVIVATYNRPDALKLVLQSLESQDDKGFEVVIADDGSRSPTKKLVNEFKRKSHLAINHIWHKDLGFRLAAIRNLAIKESAGDYLIFLDGDCIVQPDFVSRHRGLIEPGHMVTGGRVLLNEKLTKHLLNLSEWNYQDFKRNILLYRFKNQVNKFLALYLKFDNYPWRDFRGFVWRRIKGCNLACWKSDALAIAGFDEKITGWGHEDAEFVLRLFKHGVIRKSGSWSTEVLHLYHPPSDPSNAKINEQIVRQRLETL